MSQYPRDERYPDLILSDWRGEDDRLYIHMPGQLAGRYGGPLGAICPDTVHAEAGAYCHQCKGTGQLPAPALRPCRSVP